MVDELVISFTHTTTIDWMLPGVASNGKPVEVAFAVILVFRDGKITHEHIYLEQANVLVQIGLLDPRGLPISGAESARRILDPKLPPRHPCPSTIPAVEADPRKSWPVRGQNNDTNRRLAYTAAERFSVKMFMIGEHRYPSARQEV